MANRVGIVLLATLACLAPVSWISVPAAVVLLLWLPGRSLLRLLPGLESLRGSAWTAVAASMVLMPVLLDAVWRKSNGRWAVLAAVAVANSVLALIPGRPEADTSPAKICGSPRTRAVLPIMVAWIAGCVLGSFWLPSLLGNVTITRAHDYIKHHAVVLSLDRHPLPLHNVFYAQEASTPYYYYHYYYILPAAVMKLGGDRVSVSFSFGLTSALLAAVFVCLVFRLAREVLQSERAALVSAACVSVVGGFDVIPMLIRVAAGGRGTVTLDAWCPVGWRIHNVATQYFWCPQHVFAVLGFTLAVCWLRLAPRRAWWVLIGPLLAASVFGGSVYLAMVIFPAAIIHVLLQLRRDLLVDRSAARGLGWAMAVMGIVGLLLMGVQAWQYHLMSQRYAGGLTLRWERFPFALLGRVLPPGPLANWLDAPWVLLFELGLPVVACVLVSGVLWSRLWSDRGMSLGILAGGVGLAAMFTVRSDVNVIDYGFRIALMPAAGLLAVLAGALLHRDLLRPFARPWSRVLLAGGLLLGLPVGLYEAPATAARSVVERRPLLGDAGALGFLRTQTPPDAVVQGDPQRRPELAALVDRQLGVLDPDCAHVAVFRPHDPAAMRRAFVEITEAFSARSSEVAHSRLRSWGVRYVLVGSVERKHFGDTQQWADRSRFEMVYNDGRAAVYGVRSGDGVSGSRPATSAAGDAVR